MDILHLVDRLEELFNDGWGIPFTHNVIVDEDRMLDLIDQMRVAIPDEMKKAQEEANRTLSLAREKSEQLMGRDSLAQAAKIHAEEIQAKAVQEAEKTKREADNYVIDTLARVEYELERLLNQARNGIYALQGLNPPEDSPGTEELDKGEKQD
jgi:hypothetical protein